ncbi:MAG: hypothetical protein FIB08_12630 [Candidatus Methanoperedens sp.]|nr:hypothetical protein [Candidatus Methanoperedens sp.]
MIQVIIIETIEMTPDLNATIQSLAPLITTFVSLFFTVSVFRQYSRRKKIYQFIWGTGLLIFSVTTFFEFISEVYGWNIPMYRAYYVLIASLVAILGLGTVYLFNRRAGKYLTLYFAVVITVLIILTLNGQIDTEKLKERTVGGSAMPAHVRIMSPFLTIPGSIALIGGALYSWYLARRRYNLFIAIGALFVAAGGGLSRFGIDWALYILELLGIAAMYIGFIKSEDAKKMIQVL